MLKKEARGHLLVTLVWLALITLLRWNWRWDLVSFWLGGVGGVGLLEIDHLLYVLWIYPHHLTSMRFKRLLAQRRLKEAVVFLRETQAERKRLVLHSVVFQVVLLVFAFFVLTSTRSMFATGLVMGLFLHSLVDQGQDLRGNKGIARWFWQIGRKISKQLRVFYFLGMLLLFFLLNLFLLLGA